MENSSDNQANERDAASRSRAGSARAAGEVREIDIATTLGKERVTAIVFGAWAATLAQGHRRERLPSCFVITHVETERRVMLDAATNLTEREACAIAQRLDAEVGADWRKLTRQQALALVADVLDAEVAA